MTCRLAPRCTVQEMIDRDRTQLSEIAVTEPPQPSRPGIAAADHGLRAMAAAGTILFAVCFAIAWLFPGSLETRAHSFVVERVTTEVDERFSQLDSVTVSGRLGAIANLFSDRADTLRAALNAGLSTRLAAALASLCHYDCAPTDSIAAVIDEVAETQISLLERASDTAMTWAQERYSESVTELVREIRIFTGINAALFLMVLAASFAGPAAPEAARLALWLLLAATGVSIVGYVFVQDWFYSFLTGSYIGYGYAAWVSAIFLLLADWVFNRGRVTHAIVDTAGGLVSSLG